MATLHHLARAQELIQQADICIFDIDGTLLNSRDAVHYFAFLNAIREVFKVEANTDGIHMHGNTDIGILRAVATRAGIPARALENELPRIISRMCAEVEANSKDLRPELCPSIRELVSSLHDRGKILGVATGNFETIGWAKLRAAGLRDYFTFGAFSDPHETRPAIFQHALTLAHKVLPDATVVLFGDTPADISAARATGIPVIALATGIFPLAELERHSPDAAFSCCSDLFPA
ncbi:MAG: HAD family hydrolase [Terriglobales bacterium]|jgi:phosphoglycolate phosphatase